MERRAAQPAADPPAMALSGFQALDAGKIIETALQLEQRIKERFPGANLGEVAGELVRVSGATSAIADLLARPILWLRVLVALVAVGLVAVFVCTVWIFASKGVLFSSASEFLQGLEAGINELVFLGIAILFLMTIETRLKRRRAQASLHVLRSMAHIIDMHQLTKDPDRFLHDRPDTPSSPPRTMTAFELARYLDYCAEMLAILSKLAALHVQYFDDPVTVSAVNDIENLTSDLSRKLWQKIMILGRLTGES